MRSDRRNSLIGRRYRRRGYALVLVLLFNVLFAMLLGVAWRQMNSVMRVSSIHAKQTQNDQGSLSVLANAMRLLETGLPPSNPYHSGAIVLDPTTGDERYYSVVFTRDDTLPPEERFYWSVQVSATDLHPLEFLPDYFPTANP